MKWTQRDTDNSKNIIIIKSVSGDVTVGSQKSKHYTIKIFLYISLALAIGAAAWIYMNQSLPLP